MSDLVTVSVTETWHGWIYTIHVDDIPVIGSTLYETRESAVADSEIMLLDTKAYMGL